jgi:hypothetical protein
MITHEISDLGQLRVAGSTPDYYLQAAYRPFPFKSEGDLIDEGKLRNTMPPYGTLDWPMWVPPPPVPSIENEAYHIRRSMVKNIWPHAATWNLNYQKGNWGTLPENLSPTPEFQGIGEGPEHAMPAMIVANGLVSAALWGLVAAGIIRVIQKEGSTFWQIMLGVGGGFSIIKVIENLLSIKDATA